jgi:hypothetical protein
MHRKMENTAHNFSFNNMNFYSQIYYHTNYAMLDGKKKKKVKLSPVTGRESPWSCETSRLPHFLDSRLTVGGEVVSLTRWPPPALYPYEDSWYSFLLEAESIPGP